MAGGSVSNFKAKRNLGTRLRELRGKEFAQDVGRRINLSASQVTRIEKGERNCTREVLDRLLEYYKVTAQEAAELSALAQQVWDAEPPWWREYKDVVSPGYAELLERESDAIERLDYHPVMVPALLQTESYSRAVTGVGFASLGPDQVDDLVVVRAMRQRRIHEPPLLSNHSVFTEAALRFEIGDPTARHAQLDHLLDMAKLPNVRINVVPYRGGPEGIHVSSFGILRYEEPEPDVAFVHSVLGTEMKTAPRDTKKLNRLFRDLTRVALNADDSCELISEIKRKLD
ncbi:helix-turn-helix transcriptional regulator [Streptomyces sp. SID3343]|uniref:helix-turn-helix domain-containing protein n=1 Tax=Streptomyces sp. SID3343 TaxID=2690260 RepID=UPI00136DABC5|nr:helix-turn-helix transcriptional regulator [Streptomyces sp. SID3343]MYW03194.1 helix-turn-helix domain-containing protein [Streptomyces sp. SID3343]